MGKTVSEATTRLALRRLCAAYLAISGSALLFPHRPRGWPVVAGLHLLGVLALTGVGPLGGFAAALKRRWPRMGRVVADWYPLALMPFLYAELAFLNTAVHDGRYFDGWVQGLELRLFGGQPSRDLVLAFPAPALSELLHFFYLSYYPIIFVPPLYLYLRRRLPEHQRVVFTLMLTFCCHYLLFVFFPVQGPRYLFPAPEGELAQGVMYRLSHAVLEGGSSRGAAFPSSHVGVSVAQTAVAFVVWRGAAPVLALASAGLAVGAVYAGFHYATDAVFGVILGLILFAAAPRLAGTLGRDVRPGGGETP